MTMFRRMAPGKQRPGGIAVFVAIVLVCLLGAGALAVDYGAALAVKNRVQDAADAGALSGALESVVTGSVTPYEAALGTSRANYQPAQYEVSFPGPYRCRVEGQRMMPTGFGRLLGKTALAVRVAGEAVASPVSAVNGLRPFGVEDPGANGFSYGETYTLKLGAGIEDDPLNGNFHALALTGFGARCYKDAIKFGADVWVEIGQNVDTEPGNMAGPTIDGVAYLIDLDTHEWEHYAEDPAALSQSPRLITIPVVDTFADAEGRDEVKVVGFARFFLEGVEGQAGQANVIGKFVKMYTPNARTGGGAADYGAWGVRLIAPGGSEN
jgi:hypothetical protein